MSSSAIALSADAATTPLVVHHHRDYGPVAPKDMGVREYHEAIVSILGWEIAYHEHIASRATLRGDRHDGPEAARIAIAALKAAKLKAQALGKQVVGTLASTAP